MILTMGDRPYKVICGPGSFVTPRGAYDAARLPSTAGFFTPEIVRRVVEPVAAPTQEEFEEIVRQIFVEYTAELARESADHD